MFEQKCQRLFFRVDLEAIRVDDERGNEGIRAEISDL
jgi:hypothetical protein